MFESRWISRSFLRWLGLRLREMRADNARLRLRVEYLENKLGPRGDVGVCPACYGPMVHFPRRAPVCSDCVDAAHQGGKRP